MNCFLSADHGIHLKPSFKLLNTGQHFTNFHLTESEIMENWNLDWFEYDSKIPFIPKVSIRSGFFRENSLKNFKGNILYLPGLGDSILNHRPLFETLANAGYRIITFDYMGQGGSKGTMNHTRVKDEHFPNLNIHTLAEYFWQKYRRVDHIGSDTRTVLGWYIGGLAAYEMANRHWAHRIILISPGIAPKSILDQNFKITIDSFTNAVWPANSDPHIEPIKPIYPFKIPMFMTNFLTTSTQARRFKISKKVQGLVLLPGNDSYIYPDKTRRVIMRNAKHFKIFDFKEGRHELDNEIPEISDDLKSKILSFLAKAY